MNKSTRISKLANMLVEIPNVLFVASGLSLGIFVLATLIYQLCHWHALPKGMQLWFVISVAVLVISTVLVGVDLKKVEDEVENAQKEGKQK